MASYVGALWTRLNSARLAVLPPAVPKEPDALRIGILGAASIAPLALVWPAKSHPGIVVHAIAARDRSRAERFAKRHGIPVVFDSYEDLIRSPDIDAVYNPLPNGLHSHWTLQAVRAGKHVLLEKPSAANADDAAAMFDAAKAANVVVLEAVHSLFHPARQEFAYQLHQIVSPQNPLKAVHTSFTFPKGAFPKGENDIRFNYSLAGGVLTDMGLYTIDSGLWPVLVAGGTLSLPHWWDRIEVASAEHELLDPRSEQAKKAVLNPATGKNEIDSGMHAVLRVPTARSGETVPVEIRADMRRRTRVPLLPAHLPLIGELSLPYFELMTLTATTKDGSTVALRNYLMPSLYHAIVITRRGRTAAEAGVREGSVETVKAYVPRKESVESKGMQLAAKNGFWPAGTGEEWWTTYRWQLEAFVQAVQNVKAGRAVADDEDPRKLAPVWLPSQLSKVYMQVMDKVYIKSGLSRREPTPA